MDEVFFSSFSPEELTTTPVLFLQAALDSIPMPVCILKAIRRDEEIIDFEYLIINKETKRTLTGKETEGKPFMTLSNSSEMLGMMIRVANTGLEEELTESRVIDNAERLLNVKCVKFNDYISLSFREINTTAGFNGSIDHLLSIFDSSVVGMSLFKAVRDDKGVITDYTIEMVSKSIEEHTGRKDLIGKSYLKEYPGIKASSLFDQMIKVTETGEPTQIEYFYPYEGFNKWYISLFIKKDDGIFSTTLDITERKKTELKTTAIGEEIIELNNRLTVKNKDLETLNSELKAFNSVAARDYKETIQILYTNLEYIASTEGHVLSNTSKANIRKAQSAIQKMKLLTEDINAYLDLYDKGVHKSLINPNELLQDILATMARKIDQTGATIERSEMPPLFADPFLFSLLITHLLDNAIKFRKLVTDPVIKIKHSQADELNSIPGALKNTPYFIISISDNGIGFSDKEAEKIFDLFFSLYEKGQYKGSGIGLATCKKIMSMHDGFITAEGIPATGATFNCYFPTK